MISDMDTEIDYQKHRERMAKILKGKRYFIFKNGDGISVRIEFEDNDLVIDVRDYAYRDEENEFSCGLVNDAKELLDRAEERDRYKIALEKVNKYFDGTVGYISFSEITAILDKVLKTSAPEKTKAQK